MSAAPKKKTAYPSTKTEAKVQPISSDKEIIRKLSDSLTKRVIDNPATARKAATVLSQWVNKKKK